MKNMPMTIILPKLYKKNLYCFLYKFLNSTNPKHLIYDHHISPNLTSKKTTHRDKKLKNAKVFAIMFYEVTAMHMASS